MIWTKQVRYQWVMERLHGLHRSAIKSLDEHLRDAARGEFVRSSCSTCMSLVGRRDGLAEAIASLGGRVRDGG